MIESCDMNILIVDDNLNNLNVLLSMLTSFSLSVRCAISGSVALQSIEIKQPDLILLDIRLPDISGYEICQKLKQNPETVQIPIIFISALDNSFDKVKAFEAGGVDYITKPFEIAEVKARIYNQLKLRAAQAEAEQLNIKLEERVNERTSQLTMAKINLEEQIKERLIADQSLRHSESRFRALIESASDLILLLDLSGQIYYASPSAERNFGYLPADFVNQFYGEWVHPEDQATAARFLEEILANSRQSLSVQLRWQHRNGHWCVCDTIAKKFVDETGFSGIVLNVRDITQRLKIEVIERALKEEKELAKLKLHFFSMTSHEFRTPLSVILLAAQILEDAEAGTVESKRSRNIQRIQSSAQHLKQMLSDVLDIAKLEAQHMAYKPELICLKKLCDRVLATLQTTHDNQSQIRYHYSGPATQILLDPQLIYSTLINLLSNAVKYSDPEHSVQFQVTHSQGQVEFTIADRGIGIPLEDSSLSL